MIIKKTRLSVCASISIIRARTIKPERCTRCRPPQKTNKELNDKIKEKKKPPHATP